MNATIITIGDEILIGQIIDTNSAFIAKQLNKIGISIYQITSVQDDKYHILKALNEAEQQSDLVLITGGLGPTKDDITKKTIVAYFDDVLIQSDDVLANIQQIWKKHIKKPLTQLNIDQALVPSKSQVLMNKFGSAPGMWLEKNSTIFVSLPGVPFEMKALIEHEVIPRLKQTGALPFIMHRTLLTYGMGESTIANRIEAWQEALPDFIKLAYLPSLGRVRLRLSAKGNNKSLIEREMNRLTSELKTAVSDIFKGFEEEETLEAQVARRFVEQNKSLATAESCTGGKIAHIITSEAGASKYFKGSVVCYTSSSKEAVLGVDNALIKKYSVVSEQVAEAMALGVQKLFKTDYAIATTGNAGPTKGDSEAALGTVFIALASPEGVQSFQFNFGNHRTRVIQKAVNKSFEILQNELIKF